MNIDKIVVVKKKTQLEELLKRHSTTSQAKFYLESNGQSYDFYEQEHKTYVAGLKQLLEAVPKTMRQQVVDKEFLGNFCFGEKDLIVTVGDDGLLVNVAKYVGEQPIISVNPNPGRYDGVLSTCDIEQFNDLLKNFLKNSSDIKSNITVESLTMAEVNLDDGQTMYALNDFFIGRRTHVSAKYEIEYAGNKERQSSDGIVVSTGTGSTGWLTSIISGARKITSAMNDSDDSDDSDDMKIDDIKFPRTSNYLVFSVMAPFPSRITKTNIIYGKITQDDELKIYSNMPEDGVIFSDGIETDYLQFNSGRTATIKLSEKKVNLVLNNKM